MGSRHGEGAIEVGLGSPWLLQSWFGELHVLLLGPYKASGRTPSMLARRCCCAVSAFPCMIFRMLLDSCPQACTNPVQPSCGVLVALGG